MNTSTGKPADPAADKWLRELTDLLRQRHGITRDRAAELTREAGRHLAESGGTPEEEFGPAPLYALRLADEEKGAREPWWMRREVQALIMGVVGASWLVGAIAAGVWWQIGMTAFIVVWCAGELGAYVLRRRREARAG
ncbi:hypothetical protein CUT44_12500 [Streptomyces carminius]|uniref:Uncharacterized protein n=1 Tax=Streptomyces carminius TaxID=2665496 RepID=A0A2M8LZV7_9ACTN|nr:hypothetical protein [Streptomyces carminius]PJE97494.1 hypothetical protein CUT44_12500 [Streptomyces carminius]